MMERKKAAGFTLLEIMVVVAIMGLLAAIVTPGLLDKAEQARRERAVVDVRQIYGAAMSFKLRQGRWPLDLAELIAGRPPEIPGYKSVPKDPWGQPYHIDPGQDGYDWAVVSNGPDGAAGSDDDISSLVRDGD